MTVQSDAGIGEGRVAGRSQTRRNGVHWDFMLEEMMWLAKDMEKERRWKMKQSKRFAHIVVRGKHDVDSRAKRAQQEEELRIRRVASKIAKEVKAFWTKCAKLVLYKHQTTIDMKRKEVMDKHLDFLLTQGQRGEKWEKVGNWTQGEKKGRVSGMLSASLPLLEQEDP
eukprot:5999669-Pyramimonas_sp.AAC.1